MARFINKSFPEKGTSLLNIIHKDERGRVVVPKTQNFQLMKLDRSVVNSRTFVNGSFMGNKVILTGDDLAIFGNDDNRFRIFSVLSTYDSTYGDDLQCVDEVEFVITRILNIPDQI